MYSTSRPPQSSVRSSSWMRGLAFLILLLSAVVLFLKWDSIPDRWPIHWGFNGQPNGWSTKTISGVFLPVLGGALICGFLEAVGLTLKVMGTSRHSLSQDTAVAIAELTLGFLRLLEVALAIMFAFLAIELPLAQPVNPGRLAAFTIAVTGVAIAVGMVRLARGVRELKQAGHSGLEGYNGIIYKNPADPRLWVPRITGLGYTLNFAHRWAWPIMISLLAFPVLVLIVILRS